MRTQTILLTLLLALSLFGCRSSSGGGGSKNHEAEAEAKKAEAKVHQARADVRQLEAAAASYYVEMMAPPESIAQMVQSGLVPSNATTDPWGAAYQIYQDKETFFIYSFGPDGLDDSGDDIEGETLF